MDLQVINKRIISQKMRKRSKTLLSFFIQQQNWTGIQDANLTSVEFLIHRELPHYQLLCWVKWSSHLIRTCKLSYIPDWLYKVMICRVLISSNVRELGFVKSHHSYATDFSLFYIMRLFAFIPGVVFSYEA